jgi:hypothetical protein
MHDTFCVCKCCDWNKACKDGLRSERVIMICGCHGLALAYSCELHMCVPATSLDERKNGYDVSEVCHVQQINYVENRMLDAVRCFHGFGNTRAFASPRKWLLFTLMRTALMRTALSTCGQHSQHTYMHAAL